MLTDANLKKSIEDAMTAVMECHERKTAGEVRDCATEQVSLAALLLEKAAFDLGRVHSPAQTSELLMVANRVVKIRQALDAVGDQDISA